MPEYSIFVTEKVPNGKGAWHAIPLHGGPKVVWMIALLGASVGIVEGGSIMRMNLVLLSVLVGVLGFGIGILFAALGTTDSPGPPDDPASE